MKLANIICGAAMFCILADGNLTFGQGAPAPTTAPSAVPATRGGAGRGRGNPGPPLTPADQAEIATLADLKPWTPGAGDGSYFVGPTYVPAPEQTPKDGVPKGKVSTFTINAADSKFYPPTGLRGA